MQLVGYRRGLQIRIDHGQLPQEAFDALKRKLEFTVTDRLQGKEAYLARRDGRNIFTSQRILDYWFHEDERHKSWMMIGHGHKEMVADLLGHHGIEFTVNHLASKEVRPLVPDWDNLRKHFSEFRYRQRSVLELVLHNDCGIVDCCTGWGKSTVICMLCLLFPEAKIDIICPSASVIQQIYRDVGQHVFNVGLIGGGGKHQAVRVNCYCSAQSVAKSPFDADLVLVDELHRCATHAMMQQLAQYRNARHWGFTASLRRADGRHHELTKVFGPVRIKIPYAAARLHGSVAELEVHVHSCPDGPTPSNDNPGADRDRACLWLNKPRNDLIAKVAMAYRKTCGPTIIFCQTLEHLIELKRRLPKWSVAYAPEQTARKKDNQVLEALELGIFRQQDVHHDRISLQKLQYDFKDGRITKVICTGVWKAGIDFPLLRVLIRADGESGFISGTQIPGRVARRVEGEKELGILVDFGDEFFEPYAQRAARRFSIYRGHKWKVRRYLCEDGTLKPQQGSISSPKELRKVVNQEHSRVIPTATPEESRREPNKTSRRVRLNATPPKVMSLEEERAILQASRSQSTAEPQKVRKRIRIVRRVVRRRSNDL